MHYIQCLPVITDYYIYGWYIGGSAHTRSGVHQSTHRTHLLPPGSCHAKHNPIVKYLRVAVSCGDSEVNRVPGQTDMNL